MKTLFLLCCATMLHAADRWYEIRIAGQPAGYQHSTTEVLDGGRIRSTDEIVIVINRLGSKVEIKTKSQSVESATGELVSVREETTQSDQTVVMDAELKGKQIVLHSTAGSSSYDRSIAFDEPVCGPAAFDRMTGERLKTPDDAVSCRMYSPSIGPPYKITRTLVEIGGVPGQQTRRVKTQLDGLPGDVIESFDRDGMLLENERDMPFGKMVIHVADRETALAATSGGELPAESFEATMARSNVRFADARSIERIKLKLTHKKPELGWPVFRSPTQTILEKTTSTLILEVVRPERKASAERIEEATFLRPNQILQSDDAEVARLAHQIAGNETDRLKAARKLQDWVAANMTFDPGIAVVPASEVVRNRRGTCVAYSVLLTSMARAVGIPSRLAMGFIYLGGIWGGHAWVEALVDGQWLPLDAAGYRPGLADAARIQFDSYTAEDNLAGFSAAGLQMYGNVDIAVVEYSAGGSSVQVPADAERYSVSGSEYRSLGLGLSLRKPEDFTFARLDAVYPDPTILQLERGSAKVTVALSEANANTDSATRKLIDEVAPGAAGMPAKLDGRDAVIVSSREKAKLISREGQSLWVLSAEGPDAAGLLNRIAGGWKWLSPR